MQTLILSAGYEPLRQVSWQRALSLWCAGRVEVVEAYDSRVVRTSRRAYPMPAVVRFAKAARRRITRVRFSKRNVYARDGGRCQYCRARLAIEQATYDHVVPRCRGGATTWDNIVIACRPCNQRKANKTLKAAGMKPLRAPSRPRSVPTHASWHALSWQCGMPPVWRPYLPSA